MNEILGNVQGMMPKMLDQGLPKITGPSMPIIKWEEMPTIKLWVYVKYTITV